MKNGAQKVFSSRARLVESVFSRYLEARRAFSRELARCAAKGWPDRLPAIRVSTQVQELHFDQMSARLAYLVRHKSESDELWNECTSTAKVQEILQDKWCPHDEETLRQCDVFYRQIERQMMAAEVAADPDSLKDPFRMARFDPELIKSAWALNNSVLSLDRELA